MIFNSFNRIYWPTSEWKTIENKEKEYNTKIFQPLEHEIKSKYKNLNGIMIVKNGYMAYERYFSNFTAEDSHHVASVTKSIISVLIGIAIAQGHIESKEQKVLDFFPEYKTSTTDFMKRKITIKHLLTMSVPYAWKTGARGFEPLDRLRRQKNWIKYILDNMGKNGQLGDFNYSTAGVHLLSAIITRTTNKTACEFANQYLFAPIGMQTIPDREMKSFKLDDVFGKNLKGWAKDPDGNSTGGWGITLTIRDMARFGFLYLNGGKWEEKQLIPQKWIEESLSENTKDYGYLWWMRKDKEPYIYAALGSGGNAIYIIPEKDMVIAIASQIKVKSNDPWELIDDFILPVFES